jgi:CheY-like chemotaxis protein
MSNDRKYVVLVADDEPSTLALLGRHLRARGYTVLEANDGDEAWELAHEHLPHLVILDVMMPGMSGWEVCRKIREAVSLAHTGVIMLTGIGETLNEMTSPLYGADAHVDKPFEFGDLDAKITQTLEQRQAGTLGRPDAVEEIRLELQPRRPAPEDTTVRLPLPRVVGKKEPKTAAKKPPTPAAPSAVAKGKPVAKAAPAPKAKPVAKPKAKAKPVAKAAPAPKAKPVTPAKAKATAKPVAKAAPAPKAKPVAKKKAPSKAKSPTKAKPATKAKPVAKKQAPSKAKSPTKAKPATKAKPVAKKQAPSKAKFATKASVKGKPSAKPMPSKPKNASASKAAAKKPGKR